VRGKGFCPAAGCGDTCRGLREGDEVGGTRGRRASRRTDARASIPNRLGMNVLVVHYVVGILVALVAALWVWQQLGRRVMLYLLTLQIALGIWVIFTGLKAPSVHYALALVAWIGYMVANGLFRKPQRRQIALGITGFSTVLVLIAFYIGWKTAMPG